MCAWSCGASYGYPRSALLPWRTFTQERACGERTERRFGAAALPLSSAAPNAHIDQFWLLLRMNTTEPGRGAQGLRRRSRTFSPKFLVGKLIIGRIWGFFRTKTAADQRAAGQLEWSDPR